MRHVQAIPRGLMYMFATHGDAEIAATMDAITDTLFGALSIIGAAQLE